MSLQTIYGNQVSILISLDENPKHKMINSAKYSDEKEKSIEDKKILLDALNGKHSLEKVGELLKGVTSKNSSFLSPIVQKKVAISDDVALVKSLWFDDLVELPKKTEELKNPKSFKSDGMIHRQYCITTRGWKVFEHLYYLTSKGFQNAHAILSEEGIYKNSKNRGDPAIIRGVLYDTAPSYFQYADEIQLRRGQTTSNFDLLDTLEKEGLKNKLNLFIVEKKNDKNDKK